MNQEEKNRLKAEGLLTPDDTDNWEAWNKQILADRKWTSEDEREMREELNYNLTYEDEQVDREEKNA